MPTFKPKKQFLISGTNLNFVDRVFFGEELATGVEKIGATGLSGLVPAAAFTAPVIMEANSQNLTFDNVQIVLDSSSQLVVSGLNEDSVSGKIGDVITLSGENFYQITDVKFGDTESNFSVINDSEIQASVPENADYSGIRVLSSIRTGLNGSTSESSGISNNQFVPIPEPSILNSGQLASGQTLIISGSSLDAVTGVTINDIEMESVTVNSSQSLQMTVASGNVRGVPKLLARSGVVVDAPSVMEFKPLADLTGVETGVETGSLMKLSGNNFTSDLLYSGIEHEEYLVSIGGATGNFKIINDNLMSGLVPTGINFSISGLESAGCIGAEAPVISPLDVRLYSNTYPEQYPSSQTFIPAIGSPVISSVSPSSGLAGEIVTVEGSDLYVITGYNMGNVGFGTESPYIQTIEDGTKLKLSIPDASYASTGAQLDLTLSGYFGDVTGQNLVNILGVPTVASVFPSSSVAPSSTGTLYGTNLYSGTRIFLQNTSINPAFYQGDLEVSGYINNDTEIVFYYPNRFETGIDYRVRVRNRRAAAGNVAVSTLKSPIISGFSPTSGEYGDTVTISGYFETLETSGLNIGNNNVNDFTQSSTTGIVMTIPNNSLSDNISINTVGGLAVSNDVLGIAPSKPGFSGYYVGNGEKPASFDQEQVFAAGNTMTITGSRTNLITGVVFSGASGEISVGSFSRKGPQSVTFSVPQDINSGSGQFLTRDFRGRETTSPFNINQTKFSGFSNFLKAGSTFSLSGENVSGLSVGFSHPTGGHIYEDAITNTISNNVETITVNVPTGIKVASIELTGRSNPSIETTQNNFNPLSLITGVTASSTETTGSTFVLTGLNAYNESFDKNAYYVGISGTGNKNNTAEVQFFPISGMATGTGIGSDTDLFYQTFNSNFSNSFIGTGRLFLSNTWDQSYEPWQSETAGFYNSITAAYLENQISFFNENFVIQGTRVNATGFGPTRGVTGSSVEISGEGFNAVTGVYFSIPSGSNLLADFTKNSDNKITATVPKEGIESRGMTSILLSGGTNDIVSNFEVILDASVVEFNIVDQNDTPTSSTRVGNFTQRETIGGDVFLVTRTRFPDGTTAVVSSTPEV